MPEMSVADGLMVGRSRLGVPEGHGTLVTGSPGQPLGHGVVRIAWVFMMCSGDGEKWDTHSTLTHKVRPPTPLPLQT